MPSNEALVVCQSGFEGLLAREMAELGVPALATGPGWASASPGANSAGLLRAAAFAHAILEDAPEVAGEGVNALAHGILAAFTRSLVGEKVEQPWPCVFQGAQDATGLGRRVAAVEEAFHDLLKRKMGRIARLATPQKPRVGPARGLFVWFTDFGRARVARTAYMCGPCRMADDDAAPSRSYLKVEECYAIVGAEPAPGQTVCDLGAAPGGWSYSAAKRGAHVVAVDNGPLKGGALGNPLIDHRTADAFGFSPGRDASYDWLFCDLLEDPHKVLRSILWPWLSGGWCRRFIVNLKFGRVDPISLLAELRSGPSPLTDRATGVRVTHLYHDREEFTVTGSAA
jgi:23S rRNA (cytidine2498-2'-O)-methyltransferase